MPTDKIVITIDGPAGAGKTTVARSLAKKMGYIYVDTGALYRGVAWEVQKRGLNYNNQVEMKALLEGINFDFRLEKGMFSLLSSGADISDKIRSPEISMLASAVSALSSVRSALLGVQRRIAQKADSVFEGRDMGTVVFPWADYKFFLTADLHIRSKRRYDETEEKTQSLQEVKAEMARRDRNDSERTEAPLKPAKDAVIIDSSGVPVHEVVEKMYRIIRFSS